MPARILTGTMGWSYDDWRGVFYAQDTPQARYLETLGTLLPTVEVDATFYGVPRATTLSGWCGQTPKDFVFSLKAPRAITHERRLIGAAESALEFGGLLEREMGDRLAAILLQLPPDFTSADRRHLDAFFDSVLSLRGLPHLPWALEFRHESWKHTDVPQTLSERGVLIATTEKHDFQTPLRYVRLLGDDGSVPRFDTVQIDREAEIQEWATRLTAERNAPNAPERILFYIRNFYAGHAPSTIARLRELLGMPNATPPAAQQMSLF